MVDREKVIRGLECCTKDECECCPYENVCFGDDEVELFDTLARDALALLKAQEPRVRCAYCKHCFDMSNDPMEPYDGESEWYCERFDRDTSAYEIDPYRFFCADGERRDDDGSAD